MDLQPVPGSIQPQTWEGESPRNEVYLQSSFDLGRHWQLDLIGRYVENLPAFGLRGPQVHRRRRPPGLASQRPNWEFSVVGRNLGNGKFYEFGNDVYLNAMATEVVPEVYGQVAWRH